MSIPPIGAETHASTGAEPILRPTEPRSIAHRELAGAPETVASQPPAGIDVEVEVPLNCPAWPGQGPLALETLGAMSRGRSSH